MYVKCMYVHMMARIFISLRNQQNVEFIQCIMYIVNSKMLISGLNIVG